jgi:hypothetical protein
MRGFKYPLLPNALIFWCSIRTRSRTRLIFNSIIIYEGACGFGGLEV